MSFRHDTERWDIKWVSTKELNKVPLRLVGNQKPGRCYIWRSYRSSGFLILEFVYLFVLYCLSNMYGGSSFVQSYLPGSKILSTLFGWFSPFLSTIVILWFCFLVVLVFVFIIHVFYYRFYLSWHIFYILCYLFLKLRELRMDLLVSWWLN